MIFDILVDQAIDLTTRPWTRRRDLLELMATSWRPPVQLTPYTDDVEEAAGWMEVLAPMGIEGVVAKRANARYGVPGSWVKVKHRQSLEGVVGAVVGPLQRPEALVVGFWGDDGTLRILGRAPLTPRQGEQVGPLLRPPTGLHPWPDQISAAHFGGEPVTITHADPAVMVEVLADTAQSGGRRRAPAAVRPGAPGLARVGATPPQRRHLRDAGGVTSDEGIDDAIAAVRKRKADQRALDQWRQRWNIRPQQQLHEGFTALQAVAHPIGEGPFRQLARRVEAEAATPWRPGWLIPEAVPGLKQDRRFVAPSDQLPRPFDAGTYRVPPGSWSGNRRKRVAERRYERMWSDKGAKRVELLHVFAWYGDERVQWLLVRREGLHAVSGSYDQIQAAVVEEFLA